MKIFTEGEPFKAAGILEMIFFTIALAFEAFQVEAVATLVPEAAAIIFIKPS